MGFRLLANIATGTRDMRTVAMFAVPLLRIVVASNRLEMRRARKAGTPYPPLYKSPIVYNREPWAGRIEEFADCRTVLKRGWGDCDDLCAYRLAELLEAGERPARPCSRHVSAVAGCTACVPGADIRVYWRGPGKPMHVEVRRANGVIEDPSRFLGL
jgi:hypothetical protein